MSIVIKDVFNRYVCKGESITNKKFNNTDGLSMSKETESNFWKQILQAKANSVKAKRTPTTFTVKEGNCLFTVKDAKETTHPLLRIFKTFCLLKNISKEQLTFSHRLYYENLGNLPTEINTNINNLFTALKKPAITIGVLNKLLDILGYNVLEVSYTIQKKDTKEVLTIKSTDIDKL